MPSLREAMKSVAQNTSRLLSPDLQKKVNAALIDMEKKYEEAQARLRAALQDHAKLLEEAAEDPDDGNCTPEKSI